jgi:hypothetical protein
MNTSKHVQKELQDYEEKRTLRFAEREHYSQSFDEFADPEDDNEEEELIPNL